MNLHELRDAVYDFLQAEPNRGLWSSLEIDRYIHQGHLKLFGHVAEAMEDFCTVTSTISEVADQADYNLPTDFVRLTWCRRLLDTSGNSLTRPTPLRRVSRDAMEIYRRTEGGANSSSIRSFADSFYLSGAKTITLLRTPTASVTASIQIKYTFRPAKMVAAANVPFQQTAGGGGAGFDNLEEYHDLIWIYAAKLALMKEESDGQVANLANQYAERLGELRNHIDRVNIHEPRFVGRVSALEDGLDDVEY